MLLDTSATNGDRPPAEPLPAAPSPAAGAVPPQIPEEPLAGTCSRCGAAMAPGQDWCLQCGAGAPGAIGTPGWRSAALVLGITAALALGAVAAAYAALSKKTPATHMVTATVAQVAPATTPTVTTPTTPTFGGKVGETAGTVKPVPLPKTPKIPITPTLTPTTPTTTPKSSTGTSTTTTGKTKTQTSTSSEGSSGGTGAQPEAIVLDTDAASTYNPYAEPATNFGDPSLAIDGDPSTGWTALVNPTAAPSMVDGVLIDLKAKQKVASLKLITSTPGMTVQVYGTSEKTAPTSITSSAWTALTGPKVVKKTSLKVKLHDSSKAFYYVMVWISKAPATSTPQAPGRVTVNEIELFPTE